MLEITKITDEEFDLVRPHFDVKAKALGRIRRFVDDDGIITDTPTKGWYWTSFDRSKYLKITLNGEVFIIAAGNVVSKVIANVLPEAAEKYPNDFGTRNAHAVVNALEKVEPIPLRSKGSTPETFFSTEQFAFCFRIHSDGSVDRRVLRLDLFRLIRPEKDYPQYTEFIGGLFHLLKHFRQGKHNLSTSPGEFELQTPSDIIPLIIQVFFQSQLTQAGKSLIGYAIVDPKHHLKVVFFEEPDIDVYFVKTGHVVGPDTRNA